MRLPCVVLAILAALPVAAAAQDLALPAALRQRVAAETTALVPRLVETRRDIHAHPELGFRETRTAKLVADRLRALGFDEVLATYLLPLGIPVACGFPVGHIDDQWTLPLGVRARLDADAGEVELLEPAVS